ncbi:cation transporter [Candidatus Acidianus copahuensis]|uniref:Cation transporter n=1 Tax=Candidatus Acidianus copahuensis TaxID=1160895 RepID=A0A031LKW4_9CREN|nr:cation transporter [Candidatus Acidianus copahuensis]EZQ01824.1 cation transporter [Candidatus Acidianus copahuensis]
MLHLEGLRSVSKIFFVTSLAIIPVSVVELFYGVEYNSSILIADSLHGFIDASSALLFSILLKIIYRRTHKFPWGLYNLESLAILGISTIIAVFSINFVFSTIKNVSLDIPSWLSILTMSSGFVTIIVYIIERKFSWISLVKADMSHSKVDFGMELAGTIGIVVDYYWLTVSITVAIVAFIMIDTIRQVKEAIYSIIGVNCNCPVKDRIYTILTSYGFHIKNIYTRKLGSFLMIYIVVGLPSNVKLRDAYKVRKTIKRIVNSFDGVAIVDIKIVPEKHKYREKESVIDVSKVRTASKDIKGGGSKPTTTFNGIEGK